MGYKVKVLIMGVLKEINSQRYDNNENEGEKEPRKTLFVVEDYMTEAEIEKQARKRGFYNKKPHTILQVVNDPYIHMANLYRKLGDFTPDKKACCKENIIRNWGTGVRFWHTVYNKDKYKYQGKEYEGEAFEVTEAEIIGTENLYIDDRIRLHEQVINLLREKVNIEKALDIIRPEIKRLKGEV